MATIPSYTNNVFRTWLQFRDDDDSFELKTKLNLPRILLLDGGTSTFLENKLEKEKVKSSYKSLSNLSSCNNNLDADRIPIHSNCCDSQSCLETSSNLQDEIMSDHVFSHRELWSSSLLLTKCGRNAIQTCHSQFYDAGSDIVSSVTYQCHYLICDSQIKKNPSISSISNNDIHNYFQTKDINEMLRNGVRLAREASKDPTRTSQSLRFVAASIGCYGGALADGSEYTGNYGVSMKELIQFYKQKSIILANEYPDVLAYETIPCIIECRAIIHVLREELPHDSPPAWISLACCDGLHLNDGSLLKDALLAIDECDNDDILQYVAGIGINCCSGDYIPSLLHIIVRHMMLNNNKRKRVIVLYPNSGEEWDVEKQDWKIGTGYSTPEAFADMIMNGINVVYKTWQKYGDLDHSFRYAPKMIVGGCCRTTPEAILEIRRKIDGFNSFS